MLAWLHQATASEREHLEALLKHVTHQGQQHLSDHPHFSWESLSFCVFYIQYEGWSGFGVFFVKKNTSRLFCDSIKSVCIYLWLIMTLTWLKLVWWHCWYMAANSKANKAKISLLVEKHKKEWRLMCLLLVLGVEDNMQEVIGHVTEGVCRPLKVSKQNQSAGFYYNTQQLWPPLLFLQVRIEQVIVADPGAVLLYKLSNLLKFYHHTIGYLMSHITHC